MSTAQSMIIGQFEMVTKTFGGGVCQAELKNKQVQEMNRFMHYYSRFKNHENSYKVGLCYMFVSRQLCLGLRCEWRVS